MNNISCLLFHGFIKIGRRFILIDIFIVIIFNQIKKIDDDLSLLPLLVALACRPRFFSCPSPVTVALDFLPCLSPSPITLPVTQLFSPLNSVERHQQRCHNFLTVTFFNWKWVCHTERIQFFYRFSRYRN